MMGSVPPSPAETALEGLLKLIANPDEAKKQLAAHKKMRDEVAAKVVENHDALKELEKTQARIDADSQALQAATVEHTRMTLAKEIELNKKAERLEKQRAEQAEINKSLNQRERDIAADRQFTGVGVRRASELQKQRSTGLLRIVARDDLLLSQVSAREDRHLAVAIEHGP